MDNSARHKLMVDMKKVYEENAEAFGEQRGKDLFEKKWLNKFISLLSKEDSVLDVGCGTGDPIAKYLIENGLKLTGTDYSEKMIEMAKRNFPESEWLVQDMRELAFPKKFKGIIAWNSFFHLNYKEQVDALKDFSECLDSAGVLMFTAGPEHGDVGGQVNGKAVHHWSLSLEEYQTQLELLGFKLESYVHNDPECNGHSVYLFNR